MMGFTLAMLAQIASAPPTEWSTLPELTLSTSGRTDDTAAPAAFVRTEVEAGRCRAEQIPGGTARVVAPVILLVDDARTVRQIVPRAIGCATVEQYTVGYVSTLVRRAPPVATPGWYRVTVTYQWPG